MSFFRGVRNTISNISQIAIVVVLLPFIAIILGVIAGPHNGVIGSAGVLSSLIGSIPLCEIWVDLIYQFSGGLSAEEVLSSTVIVILKAFPETIITAICVYICVTASKKLKAVGLPIFATFVGIVIATIITTLTGISGNTTTEILVDFGVIIVLIISLKIMFTRIFHGMKGISGKKILLFVIDGLFAVITTAYISGLLIAAQGGYKSVGEAIGKVYILTGIELLTAVGVGLIGDIAEKDESIF